MNDIGVAEGPRGGALAGGFRFDVDIDVDTVAVADVSESEYDADVSERRIEAEGEKRRLGGENVDVEIFFAVARWFWGNRAGASGERWRRMGMEEGENMEEGEGERYVRGWTGLLVRAGRVRDVWFGRSEVKGEEGRGLKHGEGCEVE